jgi:CSLREA domain-containing protein
MRQSIRTLLLACIFACCGEALAQFTVSKTADTNDGTCDADCSLREAVIAANAAAGPNSIILPAGTYLLTLPDTAEDLSVNGDLDVNGELTITGAGAATTIIDGNNATRVIHVLGTAPLSITDVTIRNGTVTGFGGGIHHEGTGALTLTNVMVTGNDATGFGGGINNNESATVTLQNSTVSANTAGGFGGGINNNVGGTINLVSTAVSGNVASGFGGGINNNLDGDVTLTLSSVTGNTGSAGGGINNNNVGSLTVDRSTIAQNTAPGGIGGGGINNNQSGTTTIDSSTISGNTTSGIGGGGLDNNFNGVLQVTNSTVSGNTSTAGNGGGGIYNNSGGTVNLLNVTITGNASTNGGRSLHNNSSGPVTFRNTIIANPASGANCVGTLTSQGNNLASDASCTLSGPGDLPNTNPLLGPLANNGGPTQTHGLQAGSPAIDNASAVGSPPFDQRGVARPVGAGFDIGAFEGTIGGALPTLSINNVTAIEGNAGTTTFTFTVTLSAASASTVTVNFATADGTATAGSDYLAAAGTLTFTPGTTTQPVNVTVVGDTVVEGSETFVVNLSGAANATIITPQGTGTITNDDLGGPPPSTPADIPTLSEWMLVLLALMVGLTAWIRLPGRMRR